MIVEILVGAGLVGAGIALARALTKRPHGERHEDDEGAAPRGEGAEQRAPHLDDVLLHGGSELWLAASIAFEEEGRFVARLFHAPGGLREAAATCWVAQLDERGRDLALLAQVQELPDGRVPDELPWRGLRLSLRRRTHVSVRTEGEQLPPVTERAELTVLGGAGGRTLLVVDFQGGDRLALAGDRVPRHHFDLLPGGHDD